MGFRFRKSINLGGGFRVTASKSGISYSVGGKGYRVTKTARGTVRRTASIPGTGISYSTESGRKRSNTARPQHKQQQQPVPTSAHINYCNVESISNASASTIDTGSAEDILASAKSVLLADKVSTIFLIISLCFAVVSPVFLIATAFFGILKIFIRTGGVVHLDYDMDDFYQSVFHDRMSIISSIAESQSVWKIVQSARVINRKYAAGAASQVDRVPCTRSWKAPFPFRSNVSVVSFRTKGEILSFFPDRLVIIQGTKIGALAYEEFSQALSSTNFVEDGPLPRDAQVVRTTWQYVNKSGQPDQCFKNNRAIPVCAYGLLELSSNTGLNTVLMFSKGVSGNDTMTNENPRVPLSQPPQNQPPTDPPPQMPQKKPITRRWWFWLIVVILILVLIPTPESDDSSDGSESSVPQAEAPDADQYQTSIQWALLESYKCAVERDDYSGDVIKAGTYLAELTCAENLSGTDVPIVWSIYVSDNDCSSASELKEEELVAVVGGWDLVTCKFSVETGQYVYCIYPDTVGNPCGVLQLTNVD